MHQFVLSQATANQSPRFEALLSELKKLGKYRAKVYETYISCYPNDLDEEPGKDFGIESFKFVTTSKDLHLGLGFMGWDAQAHFVAALEYEFVRSGEEQMMFVLEGESILVTRTKNKIDGETVFTLAPASRNASQGE